MPVAFAFSMPPRDAATPPLHFTLFAITLFGISPLFVFRDAAAVDAIAAMPPPLLSHLAAFHAATPPRRHYFAVRRFTLFSLMPLFVSFRRRRLPTSFRLSDFRFHDAATFSPFAAITPP